MKTYKKILWSLKKPKNHTFDLVITKKDFSHTSRLYKSKRIIPETSSSVTASFVLDRSKYARFIIKELDLLLKNDGTFNIIFTSREKKELHAIGVRSTMQIMYEFSVSTGGRYSLISKKKRRNFTELCYKKNQSTLAKNDSIDCWSFGIITNGAKNKSVRLLVDSIIKQNIKNLEINICGPNPYKDSVPTNVNVIDYIDDNSDIRAPISSKKNILIKSSKFENICLLHDRYLLPNNWYSNFKSYGNYFDFLEIPNKNLDNSRSPDYQVFKKNISDIYLRGNPFLPYEKFSSNQFMQGGSIVGKKSCFERNLFLPHLHWGEFEDVHFSKKQYLDGSLIYVDVNNYFLTDSDRFRTSVINTSLINNFIFIIKNLIQWIQIIFIHWLNVNKKNIN